LNYLAGGPDDELREITQRNVEYRLVKSLKKMTQGAFVLPARTDRARALPSLRPISRPMAAAVNP